MGVLPVLRVVLGLVLLVPAFDYFLPDALGLPGPAGWTSEHGIRLMTAFEASGLLAVAKAIQLLGGALLLFNRAVPFALAAMLCVHVCGAFIALYIEGDGVRGVLALLVLALNGVLMLAYLPAYFGVLAGQSLADGERWEDGQNYNSVFVNPKSAAGKGQVFAGVAVLLAAIWFYWEIVPFANGNTGLVVLALPALVLLGHGIRLLAGKKTHHADNIDT